MAENIQKYTRLDGQQRQWIKSKENRKTKENELAPKRSEPHHQTRNPSMLVGMDISFFQPHDLTRVVIARHPNLATDRINSLAKDSACGCVGQNALKWSVPRKSTWTVSLCRCHWRYGIIMSKKMGIKEVGSF